MPLRGVLPTGDEALLARLVATLAIFDDLYEPAEDVPLELRAGPEADGWVLWRPIPWETSAAAIEELESLLPARFPPLYRKLIAGYRYLSADLGSWELLPNPPGSGLDGLFDGMFNDPYLHPPLLRNGYLQIARATRGAIYDPICLDTSARRGRDMPVVRLDHEQVLQWERIRVVEVLAPRFRALVEQTIAVAERKER